MPRHTGTDEHYKNLIAVAAARLEFDGELRREGVCRRPGAADHIPIDIDRSVAVGIVFIMRPFDRQLGNFQNVDAHGVTGNASMKPVFWHLNADIAKA